MSDGRATAPGEPRREPLVDRRAVEIPELLVRAPDAVMLLDAEATVLDVNEEACRSLGYAREELLGKKPRDFVEGLEGDALLRVMALLKERGVATFDAHHVRKDGTRFPVETRLALLRRGGPPIVVAFARDVSEQEAARRALRDSEARYQRLVELLPDGVVIFRDRRITFANRAAARLGGVSSPEALAGAPLLDFVHRESVPSTAERIARVEGGEQVPFKAERLVRPDGSTYSAELAAAPIGGGEAVAVVRDLTERQRVEAERAALEERLRQSEKLEALGTLAGGVAHDFNNVLAAILGHADALAAELPPDAPGREDALQIATAARRAKGVVQQILAFARRRPLEARPVDVAGAIAEELALVRAALPAQVALAPRLDPAAGAVRADPTHLHQILLNLCANARDAMQDGGGRLEVEVDRAEVPGTDGAPAGLARGRWVRLTVRDTGAGMDAATRQRAFEPYFTTKPVGAGSGLGLAVVHGTAVALGGAVSLESDPGRGTTVRVWLPWIAEAAAGRLAAAAPGPGRGRILLVDDDPPVARAIARMIESLGYEVVTCGDGPSALERFGAEAARFDAVMTDQTLPGMRGDEVARALLAKRPDVPVLICTGYSETLDEDGARALGARALLLKPLDRAQLGEALRAAIARER
jgi:PAS domain S-box-containing protein